ncbi:hypothetical protein ACROYT_G027611 [Oculina patagonica]
MARQQILILSELLILSVIFHSINSQQCGIDTYSIYQMMLKGHTFKTLSARPGSLDCREACNSDVRCQSYNYVMFKDICELNNRTKEARPEDFLKDKDRYYMTKAPKRVSLGSIPELPADSCAEIKASEGGQAVSGNYWLGSTMSENSILVRCDMDTETVDYCFKHQCQNNATCVNSHVNYTCACNSSRWIGDYCERECDEALGMESGSISDGQITASSQYNNNHAAVQGRLHFNATSVKAGSWTAARKDTNQWLQVDLGSSFFTVTRVATQGRDWYFKLQCVTKYNLQYSDDGVNFQYYKEQGQVTNKEFTGNTDRDTVVYHDLNPPIRARYVRFRPVAWIDHISMRVEFYGCQECQESLGMESGAISDGQITASSQFDNNHAPTQGRLHFSYTSVKAGAWAAAISDDNQWLQVDLGSNHFTVTRVATQGRNGNKQWVTKYNLQYSDDEVNFQYYKEQGQITNKEFAGNTDPNTVVYHDLIPPIRARYIRFRPVAWKSHISMRAELYGCQVPSGMVTEGMGQILPRHTEEPSHKAQYGTRFATLKLKSVSWQLHLNVLSFERNRYALIL